MSERPIFDPLIIGQMAHVREIEFTHNASAGVCCRPAERTSGPTRPSGDGNGDGDRDMGTAGRTHQCAHLLLQRDPVSLGGAQGRLRRGQLFAEGDGLGAPRLRLSPRLPGGAFRLCASRLQARLRLPAADSQSETRDGHRRLITSEKRCQGYR